MIAAVAAMATPARSAGTASEAPSLTWAARASREMRFSISSLYRKMLSCAVAKCRLVETWVSGDVRRDPVGSTRHCERSESQDHASCSRTRASRIPGRYKARFAPLSAASRLISSAGRVPLLDPRFRGIYSAGLACRAEEVSRTIQGEFLFASASLSDLYPPTSTAEIHGIGSNSDNTSMMRSA